MPSVPQALHRLPPRCRACRPPLPAQGGTAGPLFYALAAGAAAFILWRRFKPKQEGSPGGSPFKLPAGKAAVAPSSLPRGKAGNNKKNKARKKQERERRAEKKQT